MRRLIGWALILALVATPLAAQNTAGTDHADKIRARAAYALDHHCLVAVVTTDRRQLQGLVSETQADHFVLALQGHTTMLAYAEVARITWHQHMPRPAVAVITAAAVAGGLYLIVHFALAKNG
jgi:hypothetical protein